MNPLFKIGDVVKVARWIFTPVMLENPVGIIIKVNNDTCLVLVGDIKILIHFTIMYPVQNSRPLVCPV